MGSTTLAVALLLAAGASAQRRSTVTEWGQCGGSGYTGATACPTGNFCNFGNPWYSQCIPAGEQDEPLDYVPDSPIQTNTRQTVITVGGPQPTVVTTYVTYLTPAPTRAPTSTQLPPSITVISGTTYTIIRDSPINPRANERREPLPVVATALKPDRVDDAVRPNRRNAAPAPVETAVLFQPDAATPTTLAKDQYWIRAVASPNFHKYLQTKPANGPGTAILDSSKTAGQFNIVDGQLVESTGGTPLYMNVEKPADLTQRTLATWFNTTKNTFGTFVFSGDAVTWSTPEVKRQNLAAWLVCKSQGLFINTGAYSYQTPAGCADQTIHFYNGATAND